jgi:hypothetical protein
MILFQFTPRFILLLIQQTQSFGKWSTKNKDAIKIRIPIMINFTIVRILFIQLLKVANQQSFVSQKYYLNHLQLQLHVHRDLDDS